MYSSALLRLHISSLRLKCLRKFKTKAPIKNGIESLPAASKTTGALEFLRAENLCTDDILQLI